MRPEFYAIAVPASVATGASFPARDIDNKFVQIGGTFVATIDVEVTLNGGADWVTVATVSGSAIVQVLPVVSGIRCKTTAYTSGTPTATLSGFDRRTL